MLPPTPAKRPVCGACLRPQRGCICRWVTPIVHRVEVVVLQHPLELGHAKGSARLLHLSLPRSVMAVGEVFDPQGLQALISAPLCLPPPTQAPRQTLLLYPDLPQDAALGLPCAPAWPPRQPCDASGLRLVVLDGTWRKSRKMLYLNPLLQGLPRLALRDMPASGYRIRKAHKPDQLSTLEAVCAALAQLEGSGVRLAPLLAAFDGFVAQLAAASGRPVSGGGKISP